MKSKSYVFSMGCLVLLAFFTISTGTVSALPTLQLDIAGGIYDRSTETVVTGADDFTLYAILSLNGTNGNGKAVTTSRADLLAGTYYLSIAVIPALTSPMTGLGSFGIENGATGTSQTIQVTEGMTFGNPPVEALIAHDGEDLPPHDIFPTYFYELPFKFADASGDPYFYTIPYNTQDDPGGVYPTTSDLGSYYVPFDISSAGLDAAGKYGLHFDLYDTETYTYIHGRKTGTDTDVGIFAPFSHDAETRKVPEPDTLFLLGTGITVLGIFMGKFSRKSSGRS